MYKSGLSSGIKCILAALEQSGIAFILLLLHIYRYCISPYLGQNCRFEPSCSTYTMQSLKMHGLVKGLYFGGRRLLRCHPWSTGGHDEVPKLNKRN